MIRAQETAKVLGDSLNCEIKTVIDLRERNKNGILTGMTKEEAKNKYPQLVEELKDYRSQIEGAESQDDFAGRIKKSFLEIVSDSKYSTVGIVTHGMPFWVIFGELLNNNGIANIDDCGYAVLHKDGQKLTLERSAGIKFN
jgi:broad specificity phosphatase PhoE